MLFLFYFFAVLNTNKSEIESNVYWRGFIKKYNDFFINRVKNNKTILNFQTNVFILKGIVVEYAGISQGYIGKTTKGLEVIYERSYP